MNLASARGRYDRSLSGSERGARQRRALILAAAEALDELGSAGITVEEVIRRARIGRGTLYAHFDGVADLVAEVRELATDTLFSEVGPAIDSKRTPVQRLKAASHAWVLTIRAHPLMARVVLSRTTGIDPRRYTARPLERWVPILTDLIERARADGLVSRGPERSRIEAVAGAFCALGLRCAIEPEGVEGAASTLADLAVRAFR